MINPQKNPIRHERGMVHSFILRSVARFAFFIVNIFAVYLMLRGHNAPGGGFIAGVTSAVSLVMLHLALGVEETYRIVRFDPARLAAWGLLLAALTPTASMLFGDNFFDHYMFHVEVPLLGELHFGTTLAFDVGVYLVVVGIACKMIFTLAQSTMGYPVLLRHEEARYSSSIDTPIESEEDHHAA